MKNEKCGSVVDGATAGTGAFLAEGITALSAEEAGTAVVPVAEDGEDGEAQPEEGEEEGGQPLRQQDDDDTDREKGEKIDTCLGWTQELENVINTDDEEHDADPERGEEEAKQWRLGEGIKGGKIIEVTPSLGRATKDERIKQEANSQRDEKHGGREGGDVTAQQKG